MNDLDLRAALHRDADLVGEPSHDLLDQLSRRRDRQQRRRAGALAAALAVVVIGAGIPVGASFLTRSSGEPATTPAVDPTPSDIPEVLPTPVVTPTPSPVTSPATVAPETSPAVLPPPVGTGPVGCPDHAALLPLLPAPTPGAELGEGSMPTQCSGQWAFAVFSKSGVEAGEPWSHAYPQLFRFAGGAWAPVDRSEACGAGEIPDDLWDTACNSG